MMKRHRGMVFIFLIGLAMGILMLNITGCSTSGSSSGYYGADVHYRSGWGHHNYRHHHHRPPPPRRR